MSQLTTNPNQLKTYFEAISNLQRSGIQFPSNLEEVWPLVYSRKEDAVRVLVKDFIENVDYQLLRKSPENSKGRPINEYHLSVPCLEYFIARKVREVFEVYRKVFHQATQPIHDIPETLSDALFLAAKLAKENEAKEQILIEQAPKVEHYEKVMNAEGLHTINEVAKMIGVGPNILFAFLRNRGVFYKRGDLNLPYQQYVTQGAFVVKESTYTIKEKEMVYGQIYATPKGVERIRKFWDNHQKLAS